MIIYFDLDGTLLRVRARHIKAHQEAALACGGQPLSEGHYWDCVRHGLGSEKIVLLTEPPLDLERYNAERKKRLEAPDFLALDTLAEEAGAVLPGLAGAGFELVLTTLRRDSETLNAQLNRLGLNPFFKRVLCRGQAEGTWTVKRDLIAADLDEHHGPAVMVGDTEGDILAARANHLSCLCLTTGSRHASLLALYGPSRLIQSLDELPELLANRVRI